MAQESTAEEKNRSADLGTSEADMVELAALAHELREDNAFLATLEDAVDEFVTDALDDGRYDVEADEIDQTAVDIIATATAGKALSGPYLLRNDVVTAERADVQEGDLVHMVSAQDEDKIINFELVDVHPDKTDVGARRVSPAGYRTGRSTTHFGVGQIMFSDRFTVQRDRSKDLHGGAE